MLGLCLEKTIAYESPAGGFRSLTPGQVVRVPPRSGPAWVICWTGALWLTEEGSPGDVILRAGESRLIEREGVALVQALRGATVSFAIA